MEVLSSQTGMNYEYFVAFISISTFEKFPKEMHEFLSSIMSVSVETMSAREVVAIEDTAHEVAMVTEGAFREVASRKVPVEVPKSLRTPRLRSTQLK